MTKCDDMWSVINELVTNERQVLHSGTAQVRDTGLISSYISSRYVFCYCMVIILYHIWKTHAYRKIP